MNEPVEPFDEFGRSDNGVPEARRGLLSSWVRAGLRGISFGGLWLALLSAIFMVILHTFRVAGVKPPEFPWTLKSAIPLIAIGISYISLIFTAPRTMVQRLLGFLVGSAFILWGIEQFMRDAGWIAYIDDIVVFLFVLDLSIVIRENLKRSSSKRRGPKV